MGKDGRAASVVTTNTTGTTTNNTTAVQVALRIRPLTQKDRTQPRFANVNDDDCLKVTGNTVRVVPHNKLFTFDHVFGPNTQQHEIFSTLGENLVQKFIEGYNVTILAYGQTSSGKTFTMGTAQHNGRFDAAEEGIVPRAMALLFESLQHQAYERPPSFLPPTSTTPTPLQRPASPTSSVSSSATSLSKGSRLRPRSRLSHVPAPTPTPSRSSRLNNSATSSASHFKYTVKVSFVEIYNEELNDLLNDDPPAERPPVTIREDTKGHIYWTGVKEVNVTNADDVLFYLEQGTRSRATGATDMNEKSSRSHAIFSVTLQQEKSTSSTRSESPLNMKRSNTKQSHDDGECVITTSKFHFVDLAGSERLKRTAAKGDRRKEGININAGLHALGNVISALGDLSKRGTHVPYRDSKLTRLLQDSLGGNATTLMIACASPVEFNLSETLNTLQYANRARNIKNKSEKNQVEEWMTTDNLELLRTLIGKLKNEVNYLKSTSPSTAKGIMSSSATIAGFDDDDDDDHRHMDFEHQDADQLLQEHRLIIADLQHQIEELDGEASVTRERNKMVELELKRLRKIDELRSKKEQENGDWEHLVEPIIEEYEKGFAQLESEFSVSRAALNHSNMELDDLLTKYDDLQRVLDQQQEAMSDLQLRFAKIVEREQSNDAYIEELESKLEQSAHDSIRDQDTLNELRNKVAKWKENEVNNEHYIQDLERRLAVSEEKHTRLAAALEVLERQRVEQDNVIVDLQQQVKKVSENGLSQQQSMLNELDNLNEKYLDLEKDRDQWKTQAQQHHESNQALLTRTANDVNNKSIPQHPNSNEEDDSTYQRGANNKSNSIKTNRRSLADEKETSASYSALAAKEAMMLADEQASRVRVLEMQLEKLGNEHKHTIKELDAVLQRYHEALEQVDHLEHNSTTNQQSTTSFSTLTDASQPSSLASSSFSDDRGGYHTGMATPVEGGSLNNDTIPPQASMGCLLGQEMDRAQDHTISHLEEQVQTLKDKMEGQQRDLESVQKAKQQQQDSFEEYIATLKSTIQRLETEGDDAAQAIRKLEQLAEDHDDFVERTVLQLDEATESNDSLMKQHTATQAALKTLQQKHRSVVEDRNTLTQQLEQLKQEHDDTLHDLQAKLSAATALDDLTQTISDRDQEVSQLMAELTETRNQLQQSQATHMEKMEAVMASATKVQQDLNDRVQQLEQEAREKDDQHERQLQEITKAHADLLEKEKLDAIKQIEAALLEHQTEYERRLKQLQQEAAEKDDQHHTQLSELTRAGTELLVKEKADAVKELEDLWLGRQAEWIKEMEQLALEKDDKHQHQLKELTQAHVDLLDKEKAEAIEKQEASWLDRQKEWEVRVQQLEQELLDNDDRHQATLKEISLAHTEMMGKEKADALKQLESSWLERQDEWTNRIKQLEQDVLSKDHHYQTKLDHAISLEKENSGALKELESSWLERQAQWTTRIQELEQEVIDSDQRHQDTMKQISQAHAELIEKEKTEALQQIESSWLERQAEWSDQIKQLELAAADKDKKHQVALDELTQAHAALLEKEKADCLKQLESSWLDKQAKWDECRQQLEQDALDADYRHQVTVKELSQTQGDKETSAALKQLEASWADRQAEWTSKTQDIESALDTAKNDLLETQTKLKDAEDDIADLEDLLQMADANLETMTTRAEEAENNINILETALADMVKENETMNDKLKETATLNDELLKMESLYQQAKQHHETTTQKLNDALDKVSHFESQLALTKQQHQDALKAQQTEMEAVKDQLESSHQQYIQQVQSAQQQQHTEAQALKTEELAALEKRHADAVSQHTERLQQLQQQHDDTLTQLSQLQQAHDDLLSRLQKDDDDKAPTIANEELQAAREQIKALQKTNNGAELQRLVEENEEYAELTNTLEQEMNRMTQDMDKLVIEVGDNEVTLQEQAARIQQLETEKQEHVGELRRQTDQVQALEQKTLQMQSGWDQDKQQKEKLAKQVKILEDKLDMLLQEKKKFLCF